MNNEEARRILDEQLDKYRSLGYKVLLRLLHEQDVSEIHAASGATYQIEVQAMWDDRKGGNLRVLGSIDNGGWRAFVPLSSDFIIRPDGTFVDE